ncbi:microtubule-associated tumor suppressor candidate 2 isoform X1 [Alosa alosa]|uniref:microtubule-associated tumor suppressor candidate 2 isoform X1 n=1 Tax=Alosa alosa TaxID=278164 RepID=UPI00201509B8|nr:microtubule-associated tumor suppressor candidate 2 isoform X1 [Alosa alosa]XP_048084539.1 microtubule-associated tumor suppressor candidate 2 isoform X1 [Alosa alosa]
MEQEADQTIDGLSLDDNSLGQMKNTNRQRPAFTPVTDADPNANEIHSGETGTRERGWKDGSPVPPLVSQKDTQNRIIIWDTDAECQDISLEELELLECQEVEEFLVKSRKTGEYRNARGEGRMKGVLLDRQPKTINTATTCSSTTSNSGSGSANSRGYQQNNNNHWRTGGSVEDLECAVAQSYAQSESLRKARSNSEGNVFASSSFSTVPNFSSSLASALDSTGSHASQYAYPTSAQNQSWSQQHQPARGPALEVDQNHNTMLPQGRGPGQPGTHVQGYAVAQSNANRKYLPRRLVAPKQRLEDVFGKTGDWRQEVSGRQQTNGASGERKKSCDERVPPCRRQLVRPFLSETKPEHTSWASPDPIPQPAYSSADSHHSSHNQHLVHRVASQANGSSQYSVQGSGSLTGRSNLAGPCSSLERKAPITPRLCRSPSGADSPPSPRDTGSPRRHAPTSPPKPRQRGYASATTTSSSFLRAPVRTSLGTGIPTKPPVQDRPQATPHEKSSPPKCPPKPKTVRPKIITYVRKGPGPSAKPQSLEGPPHQVSSLPSRLSSYPSHQAPCEAKFRGEDSAGPVLSASNLLFDKYRQEMQKAQQQFNPTGMAGSGIKTPSYTIPHKQTSRADSFYGSLNSKYMPGGLYHSQMNRPSGQFGGLGPGQASGSEGAPQRTLRPQLGVAGAVRGPTNSATKNRTFPAAGQNQPVQAVSPAPQNLQNTSGPQADLKKPSGSLNSKSQLPKPSLSGLRPPGYSRLPPTRLTAFGFVRSSSVSSVSSTHSGDSVRSDPCRPALRPSSVSDEPPFHRIISPAPGGATRASYQGSPQPPATPALKRRSLLPPPATASKKELQKNSEIARPALSSPKRLAVVSPKPQSPVPSRQRPVAAVQRVTLSTSPNKNAPEPSAPQKEGPSEEEVQRLQERCEEQARQLERMRAELKKTTLGLEAFAICTQHLCLQSQTASEREKELSLELDRIKDKVACNREQLEHVQKEKAELEHNFHQEVQGLQEKQEAELAALEAELESRHSSELEHIRAEYQSEVEELRTQQQEQIAEMSVNHASAMDELKTMQNFTMATLQEEHTRTMRDLRKAHEQQKSKLEEDFQEFRLSLQDQVDTLTFQNQTLKDKAKRFEEALRRSADEQIVDALAPYQYIEEDLKSLKEVLEMKNQQIHDQEKKISELEKMQAHKNVALEERVQVLQQQNEDLKARIDHNLTISRHLSEENATLQVSVEKESNEKKRLSRNNEELRWRLQMSPCVSPSHRAATAAFFPASAEIPPYTYSPGPGTPVHSYSPGPATPTHGFSSGHGTPTHRALPLSGPGSPVPRCSPARALAPCVDTQ